MFKMSANFVSPYNGIRVKVSSINRFQWKEFESISPMFCRNACFSYANILQWIKKRLVVSVRLPLL